MNTFENSLLGELNDLVASRSETTAAPARGKGWMWAAPLGVAAAAVGVFATFALQAPGAYAVTKAGDGGVTVKIKHVADAGGLQKALKADGVNAHVDYRANAAAGPDLQNGAVTSSGTVTGSSHGDVSPPPGAQVLTGNGLATVPSGCGTIAPVVVTSSTDGLTFNIPAADVGRKNALNITMGGADSGGVSGLQIRWEC